MGDKYASFKETGQMSYLVKRENARAASIGIDVFGKNGARVSLW